MARPVIRQLETEPKHGVAIPRTLVQKCHCETRCPPTLMKNIVAAIYEPSRLPKHPVRWISLPGSPDLLTCHQSTADQSVVNSPSVFEKVDLHCVVSILTISFSWKAIQSVSSGEPHPVEHLCPQSRLHASYSSQPNTIPLHHAFPSMYHPLDPQAHLKSPTLSENTSHRVNGIPV